LRTPAAAFGLILKELRTRKGLSEASVASSVGVDANYIADIERGAREPTLVMVFKIAGALEITPSMLIGRMQRKLR
jgi:transcriptional regulator with XRE-family HTH domain